MADSKIICRRANRSDAPALVAFNVALAFETEGKRLDHVTVCAGVNRLFELPQYGFYLVAEADQEIAGCLLITYEWTDWRNGLFWWIQSVYVDTAFRRRGVYRALYSFARELARAEQDVRGLRLYAETNNSVAHRTYEQLGMTEISYKFFEELFTPTA